MAVDIGIVIGNVGIPTAADNELYWRIEDLGYVPIHVDQTAAVPAGKEGFIIADSVTAATVGTKYRDLTVPVITLEFDLWDDNRLAANTGAATAASAAFDLVAHTITTGLADPLTVLTSALAQRGVLDADLPAGKEIFARPGADATRAMGWTFDTGAAMAVGTAPARRAALHLPEAWTSAFTVSGVDLLERLLEWAFRPFTLTFDSTLSRVRLSSDGFGNALTATVERSTNLINWSPVRGGDPAPVSGGVLQIDDYEFTPNVANHYRVTADRDVRTPGSGYSGVAASANNAAVNPAVPVAGRAKHLLLTYAASQDEIGSVGISAGHTAIVDLTHIRLFGKVHNGNESAPTVTPSGSGAGSDVQAQTAVLRNAQLSTTGGAVALTPVAQQNVPTPAFTPTAPRQALVWLGWKKDDWTSVAALTGAGYSSYLEFGDPSSIVGNDQGIVWGFKQQTEAGPTALAANAFVVTGGASAVSKSAVIAIDPMTVSVSGSITPAQNTVWIKDLVRPFLNRSVTVVDFSDEVTPARAGVFEVVGRSYEVAVTDVRLGRRQTLTLMFGDRDAAEDFRGCLGPGAPILLQVPANCPFSGMYAVVGDLVISKSSKRGVRRFATLPLTEVAAPGLDLAGATLNWTTVITSYATWADVLLAETTWADLLEGIGSPADVVVP